MAIYRLVVLGIQLKLVAKGAQHFDVGFKRDILAAAISIVVMAKQNLHDGFPRDSVDFRDGSGFWMVRGTLCRVLNQAKLVGEPGNTRSGALGKYNRFEADSTLIPGRGRKRTGHSRRKRRTAGMTIGTGVC